MRKILSALGLCLSLAATPAVADVIFYSELVAPGRDVSANVSLRVTDEAYASGLAFRLLYNVPGSPVTQAEGVLAYNVAILTVGVVTATYSLDDLFTMQYPGGNPLATRVAVELSSAAGGLPVGSYLLASQSDELRLSYSGETITGYYGSDLFSLGCWFSPCLLTGTTRVVATVPEPASLGLFGLGLMALAACRRDGRRRPTAPHGQS